jgi:hypothetical protein
MPDAEPAGRQWIRGTPGRTWTNSTDRDWWQLVASPWPCLQCLGHDRCITSSREEIHPHCRCHFVRIPPGESSPHAAVDFGAALRKRPDLIGPVRRRLLRRGQLSWGDLVDNLAQAAEAP